MSNEETPKTAFSDVEPAVPEMELIPDPGAQEGDQETEFKKALNVTAGMANALDQAGVTIQTATNAAIILAAQLCAQLPNHDKEILEHFRRTFKIARRRFRASQN